MTGAVDDEQGYRSCYDSSPWAEPLWYWRLLPCSLANGYRHFI